MNDNKPRERVVPDAVGEGPFGFNRRDLSSWTSVVRLLHRPCDASGLAVIRILYATMMLFALPVERGWPVLDRKYPAEQCRFPLIHSMRVPSIEWIYVIYLVNMIALIGVLVGYRFRLSCVIMTVTYWYTFLLDKLYWNNHAYLYGLTAIIISISDAHRYASIDSIQNPSLKNSHVPLWNYSLLRFQIGVVYFIAGLKKLFARVWIYGYSQEELHDEWVFAPFKLLLTDEQITLFVVHHGGLLLDLFIAFLLFFDSTRKVAFLFGASFHLMNSQLFNIGMFPWVMLSMMPLFCRFDWPKQLLKRLPSWRTLPSREPACRHPDCVYPDPETTVSMTKKDRRNNAILEQTSTKQRFFGCLFVFWITTQCFLPYSHFLTRGYNTWTGGIYGYSWDMMIHSFHYMPSKATLVNTRTGHRHHEIPGAWLPITNRWTYHPDMIHQYACCIRDLMDKHFNAKDIELYLDHWVSMSDRVFQRVLRPDVDMLKAPWSPWQQSTWLMPLLHHKNEWRDRYLEIDKMLPRNVTAYIVADFPGLTVNNIFGYLQPTGTPTLAVYEGKVRVNQKGATRHLKKGQNMTMHPTDPYNVTVTSSVPSIYAYLYFDHPQPPKKPAPKPVLEKLLKKAVFSLYLIQRGVLRTADALASLVFGIPFDFEARPIPGSRTTATKTESRPAKHEPQRPPRH